MREANIIQGSKEWFNVKLGKFTSSDIFVITGISLNIIGVKTYVYKKVTEQITGIPQEEINSKAIEWGKLYEPEAKQYYSICFKKLLKSDGFKTAPFCNDAGCSPDLVGAEFKCPYLSHNHTKHLTVTGDADFKKRLKQYYWQCVMCIACYGADSWDFVSYDPRFFGKLRMFCYTLKSKNIRDDIEFLKERVIQIADMKKQYIEVIDEYKNSAIICLTLWRERE